MRKNPKPAVALLESGEVERWFQANGWTYPARGPIAKGVAAVQQFFEGMGLSKPPQLQLSETEARYSCRYPEVARGQVTLRTAAKKWVYAHADSEASWLRVTTPSVSGPQQAVIQYEVDTSQLESGGLHEGVVKLVANAGQKLNLRVRLDARRPQESIVGKMLHPIMVGAILGFVYRAFLTLTADIWGRLIMGPGGSIREMLANSDLWKKLLPGIAGATAEASRVVPGATPEWWAHEKFWGGPEPFGPFVGLPAPFGDTAFTFSFVLVTWWVGTIMGVVLAWRRGGRSYDVIYGAVAGTVGGLAFGATIACLMPLLDPVAWGFFRLNAGDRGEGGSLMGWTAMWIVWTVGLWVLQGGAVGFLLSLLGRRGRQLLGFVGGPISWLLGLFGLKGASGYMAMQ